jgi:hypothetical protein
MDTNTVTTGASGKVHSSPKFNAFKHATSMFGGKPSKTKTQRVATHSAKSRESSGETDKAKASTEASVVRKAKAPVASKAKVSVVRKAKAPVASKAKVSVVRKAKAPVRKAKAPVASKAMAADASKKPKWTFVQWYLVIFWSIIAKFDIDATSEFLDEAMSEAIRYIRKTKADRDQDKHNITILGELRKVFVKTRDRGRSISIRLGLWDHNTEAASEKELTEDQIKALRDSCRDIDKHLAKWATWKGKTRKEAQAKAKRIDISEAKVEAAIDWSGYDPSQGTSTNLAEEEAEAKVEAAIDWSGYDPSQGTSTNLAEEEAEAKVEAEKVVVKANWFLPISLIMLALAIVFASIYNQG